MSLFVQYINSKSQEDFLSTPGVSQIDCVSAWSLYFRKFNITSVHYVGQISFVHFILFGLFVESSG